jgi:SAM-dependent methyltransferase
MLKEDHFNCNRWTQELRANRLLYPDEQVIRFLSRFYADKSCNIHKKFVDIGCGSGRHVLTGAEFGFLSLGVDYSSEIIELNKEFYAASQRVSFKVGDMRDLEFDGPFDVALMFGVAFLRPLTEMLEDLRAVRRGLAEDGRALVNFRTPATWFYGSGVETSPKTWRLDESARGYAGATCTFLDATESERLVRSAGFCVEYRERVTYWKGGTDRHEWDIYALRAGSRI